MLVQSALLALLQELRERLALTYVVVTHDIAVVEALCDEMITMFRGCVVEQGSTDRVLRAPAHPYTRDLLSATLTMDGPRVTDQARWQLVSSETSQSATGCPFLARCDMAVARCTHERPPLAHRDGREVACWVIPLRIRPPPGSRRSMREHINVGLAPSAPQSHRRQLVKRIIPLVVAVLLALAPSAGRTQTPDHPIGDKLRVAAEIGFAPFNFRDAEGSVQGFEVDMNAEIAKRLGRPGIEVVDVGVVQHFRCDGRQARGVHHRSDDHHATAGQ